MAQQCPSCQHESPDGAKFCLECGTPFARTCPACGHPVSGGKFCMECGTPVAGPAAPPPPPVAAGPVSERRTTTVLFGDLVSFTTLSESRDPEEVRELLSAYFAVARTVVGRYGGTIEKFIGDAVMAVWGVPVSHEDDAERAVRAGLDLVAEVAALGATVGAPGLSMRVGIVTGSVAVTLGAVNEGMVAGDAVNTAARVQTAAAPGTVWTDQETRGLTAAAVAYTDMGDHVLKGKAEPARLFRADTIVAAVGGAQRVDGLEAPMTGRDGEIRQVKELFHATQADGRARLVVVSAQAGMGKSRLGWEFEKYVDGLSDGVRWHRGRCLSYGDGVAYWAFAEMVRSRLDLLEDDDGETVRAKVAAGVALVANDADEATWLTSRLEALLGVGEHVTFDRTDLFAAWTMLLDRVGGSGDPVVLLFEDVHHADAGLLDLLEHVLETSTAHLFVLVLTRPELLDKRPSLATGRRATVLDLAPLAEPDMEVLVGALVHDLPGKALAAVVARSEGVPLYAVETIRSLIDRDAVVAQDGRYAFVDHDHTLVDLAQLAAPTSLQTLIAARLDTLTPLERRTVQDASVLGLAFRRSGLLALHEMAEDDLDRALAALVRRGVVEVQDDPRSPERGQYRFLQALVREVAHGTLARKDRRERHLAAADHLEGEGEEVAEALAGVISQHLLDALAATSAHDASRPALAARTRGLLAATAERAEGLGSPAEALRATLVALDLDPDGEERADLQARAARVAGLAGQLELALQLSEAAFAAYDTAGRRLAAAGVLAESCRVSVAIGHKTRGAEMAEQGLELVGNDDLRVRMRLLRTLTDTMRSSGDVTRTSVHVFEVLRLAEQLRDPVEVVNALNALAVLLVDVGSPTAYVAVCEQAVALARETRQLSPLGRSLSNMVAEIYCQDLGRAVVLGDEAVAVSKQVGDSFYLELALFNASAAWALHGDHDRVAAELTAWFDGRPCTGFSGAMLALLAEVSHARGELVVVRDDLPEAEGPLERHGNALYLARCQEQAGDVVGAAAAAAASAQAAFGGEDPLWEDFEVVWVPVVELQLRAGDLDAADQVLALAARPLAGPSRRLLDAEHVRLRGAITAARGGDAEADLREAARLHEAYGSPYLVARTQVELAAWLVARGRASEAEALLGPARAALVAAGAVRLVEEADEVQRSVAQALVAT